MKYRLKIIMNIDIINTIFYYNVYIGIYNKI